MIQNAFFISLEFVISNYSLDPLRSPLWFLPLGRCLSLRALVGSDPLQRRDGGFIRSHGHTRHVAPTRIDASSGKEVANESAEWRGFDGTRVARRRDQRANVAKRRAWLVRNGDRLATLLSNEKMLTLARLAMRKLRASVGRIRELILRSRMRYPVGVPMALIVRDNLGLRDLLALDDGVGDVDGQSMPGSAASRLPLLRKGVFLLTRKLVADEHSRVPVAGKWCVARLVKDVAQQQGAGAATTAVGSRHLEVVEGKPWSSGAEESKGGEAGDDTELEFVDIPTERCRRRFRDVFPAPHEAHPSGLFVIEPEHMFHSPDGDVLRLSEDQTEFFDRVANARATAWWEEREVDSEEDDDDAAAAGAGAGAAAVGVSGGVGGGGGGGGGGGPPTAAGGRGVPRAAAVAANAANMRLALRPLG